MISHAFGARNFERLKHLVAVSLFLTFVFSVLATIPAVAFSRQFLIWMNTPDNTLELANSYIRVLYFGLILTMAYNVSSSILRAIGDSRTPLYFLILSSFLNIALDIIFIVVFKLGTAGAAYATVLSQGVSAVLCFTYIFHNFDILRFSKKDFYLDRKNIANMMSIGIPMALNHSVTALGIMILQSGVNFFGSTVIPPALIFLFRNSLVGLNNGFLPMIGGVVELVCRLLAIKFLLEPLGYWCIRLTNPITWIVTCIMFTGSYFWWEMNARKQQPDSQSGLLASNIDNL